MCNNIQQVVRSKFPTFSSKFIQIYFLNKSSKGSLVFVVEKFEAEGDDDDLLSF